METKEEMKEEEEAGKVGVGESSQDGPVRALPMSAASPLTEEGNSGAAELTEGEVEPSVARSLSFPAPESGPETTGDAGEESTAPAPRAPSSDPPAPPQSASSPSSLSPPPHTAPSSPQLCLACSASHSPPRASLVLPLHPHTPSHSSKQPPLSQEENEGGGLHSLDSASSSSPTPFIASSTSASASVCTRCGRSALLGGGRGVGAVRSTSFLTPRSSSQRSIAVLDSEFRRVKRWTEELQREMRDQGHAGASPATQQRDKGRGGVEEERKEAEAMASSDGERLAAVTSPLSRRAGPQLARRWSGDDFPHNVAASPLPSLFKPSPYRALSSASHLVGISSTALSPSPASASSSSLSVSSLLSSLSVCREELHQRGLALESAYAHAASVEDKMRGLMESYEVLEGTAEEASERFREEVQAEQRRAQAELAEAEKMWQEERAVMRRTGEELQAELERGQEAMHEAAARMLQMQREAEEWRRRWEATEEEKRRAEEGRREEMESRRRVEEREADLQLQLHTEQQSAAALLHLHSTDREPSGDGRVEGRDGAVLGGKAHDSPDLPLSADVPSWGARPPHPSDLADPGDSLTSFSLSKEGEEQLWSEVSELRRIVEDWKIL